MELSCDHEIQRKAGGAGKIADGDMLAQGMYVGVSRADDHGAPPCQIA